MSLTGLSTLLAALGPSRRFAPTQQALGIAGPHLLSQ
ncbi:hypothetical protein SDIAM103S_03785 [Streptomyces diastaticus subsp. diastaticus]|uniref:Uncharacterized protein n=1 Tax=Streptomyces griseus TaxID=1911 RepID=A0A380MQA3_STRGR|nr:hypothetical protein [Streptomyces sp. DSM 41037]SUO94354.1 Uncharacterised protein [Streptomyces griseus]